jgi:hypothetical protein
MVSGELVALLATVTLPVELPAVAGLNVAVTVAVCPGLSMSPLETPVVLNPAPAIVTFEIVIVEVPALVSVTSWLPLLAIFTLPKLKLVELEFSISVAGVTVSVAALLVALPALLLTITVNCAVLFELVSAGVV